MKIRERWESYRNKVYRGVELSETQERECARAFYSGMFVGFVDLIEISNSFSEEEALERVEAFREELLMEAVKAMGGEA